MTLENIISILVLIYSIILHEIAHGYVAYREGDNTAKYAGRLTLNPWPHIDWIGSIIIPILSYMNGGASIGWAKGVPYNPHMLKHRYSETLVAAAGVATNFALALLSALLLHFTRDGNGLLISLLNITLTYIVIINISLGIFNLIPLPPFDGLRIITSLFPNRTRGLMHMIDSNQLIYLLIGVYLASQLWRYISPLVVYLVNSLLIV